MSALLPKAEMCVALAHVRFGQMRTLSADDWWTIALGTGLRWTIEQMGPEAAARVKADNVGWLQENRIGRVETNAICAVGTKRP